MRLSKEAALEKAKHYCAYQERSHQEVRDKLYSLGLFKADVEEVLSNLISSSFLDEERFAIQFASGKFRIKNWGRIKIRHALKMKQVSDFNIRKALDLIDQREYEAILGKLASRKFDSLRNEPYPLRRGKTSQYLLQKGFERSAIHTIVEQLGPDKPCT